MRPATFQIHEPKEFWILALVSVSPLQFRGVCDFVASHKLLENRHRNECAINQEHGRRGCPHGNRMTEVLDSTNQVIQDGERTRHCFWSYFDRCNANAFCLQCTTTIRRRLRQRGLCLLGTCMPMDFIHVRRRLLQADVRPLFQQRICRPPPLEETPNPDALLSHAQWKRNPVRCLPRGRLSPMSLRRHWYLML